MKSTLKGVLISTGVGCAVYFIIYGLIVTNALAFVPFVSTFITSLTNSQIVMISIFIAITYFALNYLPNVGKSLLAGALLFMIFLILINRIPQITSMLQTVADKFVEFFFN